MKKICSLFLILCFIFSLSSCVENRSTRDNDTGNFCAECGEKISATDNFCRSCGSDINKANPTDYLDNTDTSSSITTNKPEISSPTATTKPSTPTHTHNYSSATCTEAAKCSCGAIDGVALGHNYSNADCINPQKCSRCGATSGRALGHSYVNADCTNPQKCSRCGATSGSALGHSYSNGSCSLCGDEDSSYVKTYSVGETWVVDGQWEFTVNSVTTHSLCNSVANERHGYTDEQVIVIDYTYKNIGYTNSYLDLYISSTSFKVYDGIGEAADFYSCTDLDMPKECIVGTQCTAQEDFILNNNSSTITLVVSDYTSNGNGKVSAKFNLNIN